MRPAAADLPRARGDDGGAGHHRGLGLFVRDAAGRWAADPLVPPSGRRGLDRPVVRAADSRLGRGDHRGALPHLQPQRRAATHVLRLRAVRGGVARLLRQRDQGRGARDQHGPPRGRPPPRAAHTRSAQPACRAFARVGHGAELPAAAAPHRGCDRADGGPCQQGSHRIPQEGADRDREPAPDDPRFGTVEPYRGRPLGLNVRTCQSCAVSSALSVLLGLRDGSSLVFLRDDELHEMQAFCRAWIPMRMDGARGHEQAVAGFQRDGRLAFLLPDPRAGDHMECDCRRMQMAWIDAARRVLHVVNGDLLIGVGEDGLQQGRVGGHATPFLRAGAFRLVQQ